MDNEPPPSSTPEPIHPVELTVRLREGRRVRVTLELLDEAGKTTESGTVVLDAPGDMPYEETLFFQQTSQQSLNTPSDRHLRFSLKTVRNWTLPSILFGLGLVIYLIVRFIGLEDYPIYFFSDEAISTVIAEGLVTNNFTFDNDFLPTYFKNDRKFSLSTTVYLSLLPYLLFGKSILVVRSMTVLISLLAAVSVSLILRHIFKANNWWSAGLLLSIVPAWFLHSRTGFETAMAGSFFAVFIYFYLRYRLHHSRNLYPAIFFGALTFYTYAPAQMVIGAAGIGLLISDWRYHRENRAVTLRGAGLLSLLLLPYVRFLVTHPGATTENLRESTSYLIGPYTLLEKIGLFSKEFAMGLNPAYWYFPNNIDIPRHIMDGHGNILWITLPFALVGLYLAVRGFRATPLGPAWRVILITLIVSPLGAAFAGLGVTRALFFVIPATILTAIGLVKCLEWVQARGVPVHTLAIGTFIILSLGNLAMVTDALINGPFWYTDYARNGMQYGARQVFGEIETLLSEQPDRPIVLSPDWANGTHTLANFFLGDPPPIRLDSFIPYTFEKREIAPNTLFIVSFSEYLQVANSGKFSLTIQHTIEDPNGHPAFFFLQASYVSNIDEILAQEIEARHTLQDTSAYFEEIPIPVRHSGLDIGSIGNVFDGNPETVVRTSAANPLVVEIYLPQARALNGIQLQIGATLAQVTVALYPALNAEPIIFTQDLEGTINAPTVDLAFNQAITTQIIRVEIRDLRQGDPGHVHLWEIRLR